MIFLSKEKADSVQLLPDQSDVITIQPEFLLSRLNSANWCRRVHQYCLALSKSMIQAPFPGNTFAAVTKGMISPVWAHRSCCSSLLTVDCTRCQHTSRPGSVYRCNCLSYTLYDLLLQRQKVVVLDQSEHTSVYIDVLIFLIQEWSVRCICQATW